MKYDVCGLGTLAADCIMMVDRCAYLGVTGDDPAGHTVIAALREEGVEASHVYVRPGETTTRTEIVVGKNGEKFILLIMGDAFFKLRLSREDRSLIHDAKVFFTDLLPGWAAMSGLKEAFCGDSGFQNCGFAGSERVPFRGNGRDPVADQGIHGLCRSSHALPGSGAGTDRHRRSAGTGKNAAG